MTFMELRASAAAASPWALVSLLATLYVAATLWQISKRAGKRYPPKVHPLVDIPLPMVGPFLNVMISLKMIGEVSQMWLQLFD